MVMSSVETNIAFDRVDNLPAETSSSADVCTHSLEGREIMETPNRPTQQSYRQRTRSKLEELQEKVKLHEQQAEASTRVHTSSSALASSKPSTSDSTVESVCPAPALRRDSAVGIDFLMTSTAPSDDVDDGSPAYAAEIMNQATIFGPDDSTDPFSQTKSFYAWATDTPHGSHELQLPLTPVASSLASYIPTGVELEDTIFSPHNLLHPNSNKTAKRRFSDYAADLPQEGTQRNVEAPAPTRNRVRYLMDQAAAVGFDTLDEAIVAYYTETFEDTPPLCQGQRLSRNRQLPRLLSTLHNAAKDWSEWERRGFQEQITLSAEEILVQELKSFISGHPMGAPSGQTAKKVPEGEKQSRRRDPKERKKFQDNLPNLWSLAAALLAKANPLEQDTHPDAVLAIIEALGF